MQLNPQDLVVALKLAFHPGLTFRDLADTLGLSASVGLRSARRSLRMGWWPSVLSLGVIIGVFGLQWPIVPVIFGLAVCSLLIARVKIQG